MTIRDEATISTSGMSNTNSTSKWCPDCNEVRSDHSVICTMCGATLTLHPPSQGFPITNDGHTVTTSSSDRDMSSRSSNNTTYATGSTAEPRIRLVDVLLQDDRIRPTVHTVRLIQNDLQRSRRELQNALASMRERIDGVRNEQEALLEAIVASREDAAAFWDAIPAGLLDLNADDTSRSNKPTDEKYLRENIPRIQLQSDSNLFHRGSFSVFAVNGEEMENTSYQQSNDLRNRTNTILDKVCVVPAEFGSDHLERVYNESNAGLARGSNENNESKIMVVDGAFLIIADPITLKGGSLNQTCIGEIKAIQSNCNDPKFVLFCMRGDNVTFVQKAIVGQKLLGSKIVACVVGNNTSEPWPYTMKDSKGEANMLGLNIPVVMTSMRDTQTILQHAAKFLSCRSRSEDGTSVSMLHIKCNIELQRLLTDEGCIICTEPFAIDQTVLQLNCQHFFHESCALQWLTKHNTCPYCRNELPSAADGRRRPEQPQLPQNVQNASTSATNNPNNETFYG